MAPTTPHDHGSEAGPRTHKVRITDQISLALFLSERRRDHVRIESWKWLAIRFQWRDTSLGCCSPSRATTRLSVRSDGGLCERIVRRDCAKGVVAACARFLHFLFQFLLKFTTQVLLDHLVRLQSMCEGTVRSGRHKMNSDASPSSGLLLSVALINAVDDLRFFLLTPTQCLKIFQ